MRRQVQGVLVTLVARGGHVAAQRRGVADVKRVHIADVVVQHQVAIDGQVAGLALYRAVHGHGGGIQRDIRRGETDICLVSLSPCGDNVARKHRVAGAYRGQVLNTSKIAIDRGFAGEIQRQVVGSSGHTVGECGGVAFEGVIGSQGDQACVALVARRRHIRAQPRRAVDGQVSKIRHLST